jgi:hypothetical protein
MAKNLIPGLPAAGTVSGRATQRVRTDGNRVRDEKEIHETVEMPFPVGDGNGNISVTRGFKNWFSTRDAGLTVESTVTVSVACNQDAVSILNAIHDAAVIAEEKAKQGAEEMGAYLEDFGKSRA